MFLSTALLPQPRENVKLISRILEQGNGHWNSIKKRSISRNTARILEQQERISRRCINSLSAQRSSALMSLQRQQLLALSKEDYRIYPHSNDLEEFFGAEQRCEKVSDICLLNDHFILVKMPNRELQPITTKPASKPKPTSLDLQRKLGSRLPRCFKCNRGSRVSPILEEMEDERSKRMSISPWTSNDDDDNVEVFDSRTRIISHRKQQAIGTKNTLKEPVIVEQPQPKHCPTLLPSQLKLETLQSPPQLPIATYTEAPSRHPLEWFLWPFRRRSASRPKVQLAAVHKTYFVRWNKPPETLWHGYGVERAVLNEVGLRRCRSAIF